MKTIIEQGMPVCRTVTISHHSARAITVTRKRHVARMETYIEVERDAHYGEEPQNLIEPAEIAMEPLLLALGKWKEEPVEEVDGHQR